MRFSSPPRPGGYARILAVEPQPEIFDRLAYNIRQNPFGTVKAVACAVADKTGELTLFLDPRNQRRIERQDRRASEADAVRVPAVALLDLLNPEHFTKVDAIKLDVEGAEDLILDPFFRERRNRSIRNCSSSRMAASNGRSTCRSF